MNTRVGIGVIVALLCGGIGYTMMREERVVMAMIMAVATGLNIALAISNWGQPDNG